MRFSEEQLAESFVDLVQSSFVVNRLKHGFAQPIKILRVDRSANAGNDRLSLRLVVAQFLDGLVIIAKRPSAISCGTPS